jgi:deltex
MTTRISRRRKLLIEESRVVDLVSSEDEQEKKPRSVAKDDKEVNVPLGAEIRSRSSDFQREEGKVDGLTGVSGASSRSISRTTVARKRTIWSVDDDGESLSTDESEGGRGFPSRRLRPRKTPFHDPDEALARKLQAEEDRKHSPDFELAKRLQAEEEQRQTVQQKQEKEDAAIAASIKSVEDKELDQRKKQELDSMKGSMAGRSVLLVEKTIRLIEALSTINDELEPVGKDDAVFLAEKMLELQATFKKEGKPYHVCIGYHYTPSDNLNSIRTDGLLTVDDRIQAKHTNTKNSAFFGNGLYTATNPLAFTPYGDVGLLMAVLKGKEEIIGSRSGPPSALDSDVNTVIGNKKGNSPFQDEVILKTSSQALPLVKFNTAKITDQQFADMIWTLHQQIQHQVLDEYFNESAPPTIVNRVTKGTRLPASVSSLIPASTAMATAIAAVPAQTVTPPGVAGAPPSTQLILPGGPASLGLLGSLPTANAQLSSASRRSLRPSLQETIRYNAPQNMASGNAVWLQGKCPSGTMTVTTSNLDVAGFATCGSIAIHYQIPSGVQLSYHPNPGVHFVADSRVAYLPNNQQGQDLLKRLKYAFSHGLTFTVGTSMTTRISNVLVWSSIPHKTSMSGGDYGWPDVNFFANCDLELDAVGVPPASQL